jgi:radical SAM/Cys-rich protein
MMSLLKGFGAIFLTIYLIMYQDGSTSGRSSLRDNRALFNQTLARHGRELRRAGTEILQLNVGRVCNLTCVHCHVNAGPWRKEIVDRPTLDRILDWFEQTEIPTLDLTGGAPEMIPDFRYLVERVRRMAPRRKVMDRCNLTILLEPGFEDLARFLADHQVEVIASMPCYSAENVEKQRGDGVFDASIAALQLLNRLGYGREEHLPLHLVYNPGGPSLPPEQEELRADYKRELDRAFGIVFNELYCITNLPIARFESYLKRNGSLEDYMRLLMDNFNPATVDNLMCRNTLSIDWQGRVFDCDFNQMLDMAWGDKTDAGQEPRVWDLDVAALENRPIMTGAHCFGCTAGSGSSCGGEVL